MSELTDPMRTPALSKAVWHMTDGACRLVGTKLVLSNFYAVIERVEDRQRVEVPVDLQRPYLEQLQPKLLVFA